MTWHLLAVCTGNLCRSPAIASVLEANLPAPTWVVASAGTHARSNDPAHPLTAAAMRAQGLDPSTHRSRWLTDQDIDWADLILTADREHRTWVVQTTPVALGRTFTVREFARLAPVAATQLGSTDPAATTDLGALLRTCRQLRGQVRPAVPSDDDVPDPIAGSERDHEESVALIAGAVASFVPILQALARPTT